MQSFPAELMRGIRNQLDVLVTGNEGDLRTMALGLAHSLSRYKLKFSPDKVDTMIVQAICMLNVKPPLYMLYVYGVRWPQ